ncbi:hypothetical protein XELAEV_18027090mg [Xenopus laevis]|uniref:Uncharacterized protein n=1 Tax=Xenopus laevis TaxID=8355 RepID=A0A974CUW1_XENLA|nr:hypothetical protein XELAEV_18027090mg [Xenopus laevis]
METTPKMAPQLHYSKISATVTDAVSKAVTRLQANITDLGQRTAQLETKMTEAVHRHNVLVDEYDCLSNDFYSTQLHLEDMEEIEDFERAFDSLNRRFMWSTIEKYAIPRKIVITKENVQWL